MLIWKCHGTSLYLLFCFDCIIATFWREQFKRLVYWFIIVICWIQKLIIIKFSTSCFAKAFFRSSRPEMLLVKDALKKWSKFTGEHRCRSEISLKLQSNFIEITLWHGFPSVNLLHIFRTSFSKNTSGWLPLFF